jgi:hypothetical protein
MATHPSIRFPEKLERLLAFHENAAAAVRATMALLAAVPSSSRPGPKPSNGIPPTIRAAVAIRRAARPGPKPNRRAAASSSRKRKPSAARMYGAKAIERRKGTAAILAQFDPREPRLPGEIENGGKRYGGIGPLVRRGYLKRRGDGFVRTGKPFHVSGAG